MVHLACADPDWCARNPVIIAPIMGYSATLATGMVGWVCNGFGMLFVIANLKEMCVIGFAKGLEGPMIDHAELKELGIDPYDLDDSEPGHVGVFFGE